MIFLAIGIATNFILLNAPLVIYTLVFNDNRRVLDCQSNRGKTFNVLFALRALSKLTDPLLYFYVTYKLHKRRVFVAASRQITVTKEITRASTEKGLNPQNNQGSKSEMQAMPDITSEHT